MRLALKGLEKKEDWKKAGINLPSYDIAEIAEATKKV